MGKAALNRSRSSSKKGLEIATKNETPELCEEMTVTVKRRVQMLEHAVTCPKTSGCEWQCKRMKKFLSHSKECQRRLGSNWRELHQGDNSPPPLALDACRVFHYIIWSGWHHSRSCSAATCQVPHCFALKLI